VPLGSVIEIRIQAHFRCGQWLSCTIEAEAYGSGARSEGTIGGLEAGRSNLCVEQADGRPPARSRLEASSLDTKEAPIRTSKSHRIGSEKDSPGRLLQNEIRMAARVQTGVPSSHCDCDCCCHATTHWPGRRSRSQGQRAVLPWTAPHGRPHFALFSHVTVGFIVVERSFRLL
jgi:hypothetical protein